MSFKVSLSSCLIAAIASTLSMQSAFACTDFLLKTKDGCDIVGRSLEWSYDLECKIESVGRGQYCSSSAPGGQVGLKWHSLYGYVAVNSGLCNGVIDGVNEKGLSAGALWLPGTVYQEVPAAAASTALSVTDLGAWILGNFTTTDEVAKAIAKIKIWCPTIAGFDGNPTVHYAVHDATGESLVIEFVDGEQKIYHNRTSILTNAPTFDWHLTNLNNYAHLSPDNPKPIVIKGTVLAPPGQGGGFLGIPGDWTPPSRFVRVGAMLALAQRAKDAQGGVTLAQHLLNAVDIPLGDVGVSAQKDQNATNDYTQWVVIKDLTNRVFYYRSYNNLALKAIDLKQLDFSEGAPSKSISIDGGAPITDATAAMR